MIEVCSVDSGFLVQTSMDMFNLCDQPGGRGLRRFGMNLLHERVSDTDCLETYVEDRCATKCLSSLSGCNKQSVIPFLAFQSGHPGDPGDPSHPGHLCDSGLVWC